MLASKNLSIIEAFSFRHSCRTFQQKELSNDKKEAINNILLEINSVPNPLGSQFVEISQTGPGLSRFGSTSHEVGWLVEKIPKNNDMTKDEEKKFIIDASFKMQLAVMKMSQHQINTCWMAGTFNEGEAEKRFPGYKIAAVVAYGEEKKSKHMMGWLFGLLGGHESRLNFNQLFYDDDIKRELNENDFKSNNSPIYRNYLEDFVTALRSGPSPMNLQTWRFVFSGKGKEVNLFDIKNDQTSWFTSGIALANLFLLAEIKGGSCTVEVKNPVPAVYSFGGKYIATVTYSE